jgi:hypothetical protein
VQCGEDSCFVSHHLPLVVTYGEVNGAKAKVTRCSRHNFPRRDWSA